MKKGIDEHARRQKRRISWLWIGLGTYFLIFLNAAWHAHNFDYRILALGAILNFGIMVSFIVALKRAYARARYGSDNNSQCPCHSIQTSSEGSVATSYRSH